MGKKKILDEIWSESFDLNYFDKHIDLIKKLFDDPNFSMKDELGERNTLVKHHAKNKSSFVYTAIELKPEYFLKNLRTIYDTNSYELIKSWNLVTWGINLAIRKSIFEKLINIENLESGSIDDYHIYRLFTEVIYMLVPSIVTVDITSYFDKSYYYDFGRTSVSHLNLSGLYLSIERLDDFSNQTSIAKKYTKLKEMFSFDKRYSFKKFRTYRRYKEKLNNIFGSMCEITILDYIGFLKKNDTRSIGNMTSDLEKWFKYVNTEEFHSLLHIDFGAPIDVLKRKFEELVIEEKKKLSIPASIKTTSVSKWIEHKAIECIDLCLLEYAAYLLGLSTKPTLEFIGEKLFGIDVGLPEEKIRKTTLKYARNLLNMEFINSLLNEQHSGAKKSIFLNAK